MLSAIADILKYKLTDSTDSPALDWIERFGGLVISAAKANTVQSQDGAFVNAGYQYWPVACDVNAEKCFEDFAKLKWFVPDSSLAAVAFFTDGGGTRFLRFDENVPQRGGLVYQFNLRFLCWVNMKRLGDAITSGECYVADKVVPYVIAKFFEAHSAATVFGSGTPKAKAYRNIEVTSVSQLQKQPSIFNPFTFAQLPDKQALFIWPYDYFGLQIQGEFTLHRNCLAELYTPPFVPETDICLPGEPTDNYLIAADGDHITTGGDVQITT